MTSKICPSYEASAADPWTAFVAACISISWADQAFKLGLAPDSFAIRFKKVAALVSDVVPRLAASGELSDTEYDVHLRDEMHRQLAFLDATTRRALARHLVLEFANSCDG